MREQMEALIAKWRLTAQTERASAEHETQREIDLADHSADTYEICADELAALLAVPVPQQEEKSDGTSRPVMSTAVPEMREVQLRPDDVFPRRSAVQAEQESRSEGTEGVQGLSAVPTGEGLRALIARATEMAEELEDCGPDGGLQIGTETPLDAAKVIRELLAALTSSPDLTPGEPT
jgi:hypothetical protein